MRENSLLSNLAVAYATYIASTSVSTVILQFVYNILRDLARMRACVAKRDYTFFISRLSFCHCFLLTLQFLFGRLSTVTDTTALRRIVITLTATL